MELWQTRTFTRDRVNFERLGPSRPAPRATLKKNWHSQQQQHSTSGTEDLAPGNGRQKGRTRLEHKTLRTTPQKRTSPQRKLGHTTSNMDVDTHFGDREVSRITFLQSEAMKEESQRRTQKQLKESTLVRTKICIREDLAKENMMFSQESSQAIFEMGKVEPIGLKTIRIQCPLCLHYVLKGTIFCACGKHIRPDQEMTRRVKVAFEILKAPYFRTSMLTSRGYKHGPNLWQEHHHKAKDAPRSTRKNKRTYTSIWNRWQNGATYRESELAIGWSDAWARYLENIAQIDISHEATPEQRGRYHNLIYPRGVGEDRQVSPLSTRPRYQEAMTAKVEMQRQSRQDVGITFILKSERKRSNDQLDPSLRWYLEWLKTIGPSTSKKNANSQPHLSLLSGLQHPGGAHTLVVFELERMASTQLTG